MEIHKPKPWHGLREFLREYAIIVVGVLTALSAEAGVEWLHWRHVAEEAEAHLAAGVGPNLVNAVEWIAIEPCLEGRVADLAATLQQAGPLWKASVIVPLNDPSLQGRIMPLVVGSPGRQWPLVAWESALTSGALTHMPRDRVDLYAEVYRLVEVARDQQRESGAAGFQLSPLGYDRLLTPAERTAFLGKLAEVEQHQRAMFGTARQMLRDAHRLGLKPQASGLSARMQDERRARGACVTDVKLPLS